MRKSLPKIEKKAISQKSHLFRDVICIPNWTKHNFLQEDPIEGEPAEPGEVFKLGDAGKILECFHLIARKALVCQISSGVWYEASAEELERIRLEKVEVKPQWGDIIASCKENWVSDENN